MLQNTKGEIKGTVLGLVSAIIGGVCPVYWKQIKVINSAVILCYRVVLVCVCMFLICLLLYGWEQTISPLRRKGAVRRFLITGTIMVSNWGVYVWSVNSGHIIQASIGYYIMPLIVCLIGMIIFHEPVTKNKVWGLAIVTFGVVALVFAYGEFPTIALAVAVTYATYTSAQKGVRVTGIQAMFYQTLLVAPPFLVAIIYLELSGQGAFAVASNTQLFILSFAGIVTALPLVLMLDGINCASLIIMGLTNYLGDTVSLLIGVYVYKERMDLPQLMALSVIWIGIAVYTVGSIRSAKAEAVFKGKGDDY
ncbi:EamA family transporter RarD [Anaerotruncus rubiinfantis]|uniref:EamA family transporter RarD n=1 Tax=Anaerotruncus rubiinfantis TaxID=1720200 RepID=UPI003D7A2F4D